MKRLILLAVVFVGMVSCAVEGDTLRVETERIESSMLSLGNLPFHNLVRIDDIERGVVCYAYRDYDSVVLDCMPDTTPRY